MAKFGTHTSPPKTEKSKDGKKDEAKKSVPTRHGIPEIVEPRCSVCKHENRRHIDKMLVMGHGQMDIIRHFEMVGTKFTKNAMSNHARKHLTIRDAAIRGVLDRKAAQYIEDVDEVEGMIITRDAFYDAVRTKAFERLLNDEMEISVKDTLEILDRMDAIQKSEHQVRLDGMISDLNVLIRIIRETVTKEQWPIIAQRWNAERVPQAQPLMMKAPKAIEAKVTKPKAKAPAKKTKKDD